MRDNFTQLYVHYVWATWDRLPLITPDIQEAIYAVIIGKCNNLKCTVIAVGGIEDHLHLLVGFPSTLTVAEIIKEVKGSSSHLVTHELKPGVFFKWQGSYGAFTVSHDAIDTVANYIKNQAVHHRQRSMIPGWEVIFNHPAVETALGVQNRMCFACHSIFTPNYKNKTCLRGLKILHNYFSSPNILFLCRSGYRLYSRSFNLICRSHPLFS